MPTRSSRQVRTCNYACPLVYRAAIWRCRTKNYHYLSPWRPPYTDGLYQTVYEYHRFEINTTKITNRCAVEFTALPSEWSSFLHCHVYRTISSVHSTSLHQHSHSHTRPCISVQPACSTTAVNSAAHPAKPLTAAGATFSRGERDIRASPRAHSEPFKLWFTYFLCAFRCSDGMDRHRQEWLDYACSNQV